MDRRKSFEGPSEGEKTAARIIVSIIIGIGQLVHSVFRMIFGILSSIAGAL